MNSMIPAMLEILRQTEENENDIVFIKIHYFYNLSKVDPVLI